jgi:DNA-directed RNA polymerase subunit F
MLRPHEIESMRRSHAMAPLSPSHVDELIESCAQLAREREQIARILSGLPESFSELRAALNELHRLVR